MENGALLGALPGDLKLTFNYVFHNVIFGKSAILSVQTEAYVIESYNNMFILIAGCYFSTHLPWTFFFAFMHTQRLGERPVHHHHTN